MQQQPITKIAFGVTAIGIVVGVIAFFFGAGPMGWADFSEGAVWYLSSQWRDNPLVLPLVVITGAAALALAVVFITTGGKTGGSDVPDRGSRQEQRRPDERHLINVARRALDRQFTRSNPRLEQVMDLLLGVPLDVGASELRLQPGPIMVDVALRLPGGKLVPVTSIGKTLHDAILRQLRSMIGVQGDGDGVLDFHSQGRIVQILVSLKSGGVYGAEARLRILEHAESDVNMGPRYSETGFKRSPSMIMRLETTGRADYYTGQYRIVPHDGRDPSDSESGRFSDVDIYSEIRSIKAHPMHPIEAWARLAVAVSLALLVVVFFGKAYGLGLSRLSRGTAAAPWREVMVVIRSTPVSGEVTIHGSFRGKTPLVTTEPCRGKPMEILLRAEGYTTWQWSGICPRSGPLQLQAQLKPQQ